MDISSLLLETVELPMTSRNRSFDRLSDCVSSCLVSEGFRRQGTGFRLFSETSVAVIQLQKGSTSTTDSTKFTLNLGVVCGLLLQGGIADLKKARFDDSHLRCRIGGLLAGRPDRWWIVSTDADAQRACMEVCTILLEKGIPYLRSFLTADSLLKLWEKGDSPGITEFQRIKFLEELRAQS